MVHLPKLMTCGFEAAPALNVQVNRRRTQNDARDMEQGYLRYASKCKGMCYFGTPYLLDWDKLPGTPSSRLHTVVR